MQDVDGLILSRNLEIIDISSHLQSYTPNGSMCEDWTRFYYTDFKFLSASIP